MNLEQFLLALKARYKIVLLTTIATVVAAVIISLLMTKMYTASSAVVIDVKYADPIAGSILPALTQPSYMATQLDILQSDRIAMNVVRKLKLDESASAKEKWMKDTDGKGSFVSWLAEGLKSKLDVKPQKDSNVVTINFKGPNPAFVATVADAFAQAYIDTSIELRVEPAKQYSTYFEDQSRVARDRLEKAQTALSEFQRDNHIVVVSDERLDTETSRLGELSTQLSQIQGQKVDTQSRENQIKASTESLQEVLQNPLLQGLKSELARQEAKLQELGGNLGPNNPQYLQQRASVTSLRQQIATETRRITDGIATSNRVNQQRSTDIQAAYDAQKARVLKFKEDRDAAAVLQRDVDVAQRAFDTISQRTTQSNLESQANQTNIAILNHAVEPTKPSSPRILLNILVAIVAGLILGTGGALIAEQLDRRVRSMEDLNVLLGLPVLGAVGRTRALGGPRRLALGRRGRRIAQLANLGTP